MDRFVGRQTEIAELNRLLKQRERIAQFIVLYGRRRVGKTFLLLHWVQQTEQPYLYWVARRETADATRYSLTRAFWKYAFPGATPPRYDTWEALFEQMADKLQEQPLIMIWDEFPYAAESDPSLPSHLQAAWDHLFKDKQCMLILAGSHVGMMVDMMNYQAPLYGRFTGQMFLKPLPFQTLSEFFPRYDAAERVVAYACLGGVPAYLEWFDPGQSLIANIKQQLFSPGGMFRSEPMLLISDLVRETRLYEAILRAIAGGLHTPAEITSTSGISSPNLQPYLKRLIDLRLIERRVPVTIPDAQRETTTRSRYHLSDPYLRFYYRFVEPDLDLIELGQVDMLWNKISEQFRAFIGATTFEEICRDWVAAQTRRGQMPFLFQHLGSHWATDSQVDVVAINWQEKAILLGECKWGLDTVGRSVIRELIEKTPKVVPGEDWQVHYAFFARAGFTDAAIAEVDKIDGQFINLTRLDQDLRNSA
jgi:AAA+ ATPase superfamily predicted ATPase